MKKKIFTVAVRVVSTTVILVLAAACSDGQHSTPTDSLLPAKVVPAITKFQISRIGGTEPAGKSAAIELGDSVLLEWEVAVTSAKGTKPKITLDAEALNIRKEDLAAKDSVVISSAVKDAEFTLTVTSGKDVMKDKVEVKVAAKKTVPDATTTVNSTTDTATTSTPSEYHSDQGSDGVTDAATAMRNLPQQLALNVRGGGVIFAGEEATITWSVAYKTGCAWPPAEDATVVIKGGVFGDVGQVQRGASGEVKVTPAETTEYSIEASAPNALPAAPAKVKVSVRKWEGPRADKISINATAKTTMPVSSLGLSRVSNDMVYAGYDGGLTDVLDETGAKAKGFFIARGIGDNPYWEALNVPFMKVYPSILGKKGKNNIEFFEKLKYPVNVITTDPKNANRIYAGTTGGVLYSNDGGKKWSTLVGLLLDGNVALPHATCNGKTSAGWPGQELHGLSQVCDIEIASDGRFIIATDMTVEYLSQGVDAALEKDGSTKATAWAGFAGPVTGHVNYDLELVNSDGSREILFVGTPEGILRSPDMGATYEPIEGNGAPEEDIYSIEVDTENHALYAGGNGKIYVCLFNDYDCKEWRETTVGSGDARVYSIALDPAQKGGVLAATSKGLFYSVDGNLWKDVASDPMTAGTAVTSVKGVKSVDGKKGTVYVGTSKGVFVSTSEIADASAGAAPEARSPSTCLAPKKMIPSTLVIKNLLQ